MMQDSERKYLIACVLCFACAIGIALLAWKMLPPSGDLWGGVICFTLYATLAELLAVVTDEGRGVTVSPTSPILWAATCILGPCLAIISCAGYSTITMLVRGACHALSPHFAQSPSSSVPTGFGARITRAIQGWVLAAGEPWQSRGFLHTLQYLIFYISTGVLVVGPSGLFYHALGGVFLGETYPADTITRFIAPFIGLVALSIVAEHAIYTLFIVAVSPKPVGKGSFYSSLLKIKLILLEDVLPVWRGQIFLIIVSLLLSYLYMCIGVWGFVLTAIPVLALRDFFRQWVEERAAYVNTITTLATYMQHYHPYTRGHLKRVADMSERLARELRLPAESIRHISTAGFLHDIGKIAVSEEVLDKTSKLTDDEWAQIREHPVKGAEIISHIEFLEGIADWIRYHHKWYNGSGYPATNGDACEIPIEALIIATVDAFDAMTDDREMSIEWHCDACGYQPEDDARPLECPVCGAQKRRTYREPKSLDEAIDELRRGAGSQFDPRIVKAFLSMVERDGIRVDA